MYIDVQLLSEPSCLPLVGLPNHYSTLLTTTLYHPMVWMEIKESPRYYKLYSFKDWYKSCDSFSVANWCSNKYERRVLPLSVWMILVDHEVSRETFYLLPFYPVDGQWVLTESGCRKRGISPFSFSLMDPSLCSRHLPRIRISLQLCYFFRHVCVDVLSWLTSQSCKCGEKKYEKEKKKGQL